MSDSIPEQISGGDNLRERYLPVSRKELRRRREAELAVHRGAFEEADAAADELDPPETDATAAPEPEASVEAQVPGVPDDAGEDELARTLKDVQTMEDPAAGDLAEAEREAQEADSEEAPEAERPLDEDPEATQEFQPGDYVTAPVQQVAHDAEWPDEEQTEAAPSYSGSHFGQPGPAERDDDEAEEETSWAAPEDAPEAPLPEPAEPDQSRPEEEVADALGEDTWGLGDIDHVPSFEEQDSSEPEANDEPDSGASTELITYPQADSGEVAPIPASRRAWRLLRETSSIPRLDEDMLAELDELTSEIKLHDDPENVDPELLRRQQAFAAKAMQANQARLRQEQAEREAREAEERRWRRHHPPESDVIASKTVRDAMDSEHDYVELPSGSIEPVEARGAHGLDIDKLVDETSKEANRPNVMLWLVIVLALLLAAAVVVLFTVVL
ncbi:hypothetical protein [Nesterenkonia sp. NBAIMH1]|uniref:hypothetical protein n=1 Tax=Nesterenkonia sp. NBAIMH1 TaxID=2600320 RepID=UPI0011B7F52E|nr:hypothetical protein [Nesterenkonia sp. NBAIMH1]